MCCGGGGNDEANCIMETIDGGYIMTGTANSNDQYVQAEGGGYDVWVVKLEAPSAGDITDNYRDPITHRIEIQGLIQAVHDYFDGFITIQDLILCVQTYFAEK